MSRWLQLRQRHRLWRDIATGGAPSPSVAQDHVVEEPTVTITVEQKEAILQRIRDMENELAELRRALLDLLQ